MHASKHLSELKVVIAAVACLGFCACGSSLSDRGSGGSGSGGLGTAASGGSPADAAVGTGGSPGAMGGTALVDAPVGSGGTGQVGGAPGSGGKSGTGGWHIDGGAPGSGGKSGTGGQTGTGGSPAVDAGARCGGVAGTPCPTGQYCDILDHCHKAGSDFAGLCVPSGPDVICPAIAAPVCGCNGKTYPNDCERGAAKVQKFSDGPCVAGRDASAATDELAYLSWGAVPVGGKTGPGVVVSGIGYYGASTEAPIITALMDVYGTPTWSLSHDQVDTLFAHLGAIDFSALPHATAGTPTCKATLEVFLCRTCSQKSVTYSSAAQVAPEMEPVWAWFDELLGSSTVAINPRTYCSQ